ncbi:MAG: 50S ribosomal protein L30 [Proteobacteria bacterium]|nr:50S ribosomal protein L30 [Pseudomonadota bacterium]
MEKEIKVTQIRSLIGRPPKHRRTIRALGLTKINKTVVHKDTPSIRGMIQQVCHLVKVEE